MSGYAAVAAFCAVSVGANLQYGLSLGRIPIDKATYAVASVAADAFKMAAPLLALSLWSKRFHILAIAGLVLWLGCVGWSMASAVGFVLSSRGDAIAERAAEAATRHGWEAKVERAENQLATLGKHRPPDVIKREKARSGSSRCIAAYRATVSGISDEGIAHGGHPQCYPLQQEPVLPVASCS